MTASDISAHSRKLHWLITYRYRVLGFLQPFYSLVPANAIKCPIVLHEHATQPGVFVYNHFMD